MAEPILPHRVAEGRYRVVPGIRGKDGSANATYPFLTSLSAVFADQRAQANLKQRGIGQAHGLSGFGEFSLPSGLGHVGEFDRKWEQTR